MALSRRLARPLLASIFVVGGWEAFWNPASKAKKAEAVTGPLTETAGIDGLHTETLVRVNGAVQMGGGILLAVGKYRRVAALVLIGSIIPTTYAGHRFWEESDPTTRSQQKMHFLKNVGLLGGLILAAFDTEGEPSLAWRAKRQAHQLESSISAGRDRGRRKARRTGRGLAPAVSQASKSGRATIRRGRDVGRRAGRRVGTAGHELAEKATPSPEVLGHAHETVADAVRDSTETATHVVQQAASFVADAGRQLEPLIQNGSHPTVDVILPHIVSGADRTADALSRIRAHLPSD